MRLRIGVVQRLPADRAEPGAIGAAEKLVGQRQDECVVRPPVQVEIAVGDVRAAELLVAGGGLVDLASVHLDLVGCVLEAANAGAGELHAESQPKGVAGGRLGDVQSRLAAPTTGCVDLTAELDRVEINLEIEGARLSRGQRETLEIDGSAFRIHSLRG